MSDPRNLVRVVSGGKEFGGWKSVRIEAGIERIARSFDLEVTDKWPGSTGVATRIHQGDLCQVYIGDDLVCTGYVDATPIRYDAHSVSTGIKGRSKTADLVDCGAINKPGQWRGLKMEAICGSLCSPYGISVVTQTDTGDSISDHQIQQGESVFESIDRMMRLRHVLATDNEKGELVFIDVGSGGRASTALELGKNLLTGNAALDYKGVYSEYVCKGQRTGEDDEEAIEYTGEEASVSDATTGRRRVLVLKQSGQANEGTCKDRVEYERAHRAAKALQTAYLVNGWRQDSGQLWLPNQTVRVRDPLIGFDQDMLVAETAFRLDASGLLTEITVGPKDGYVTKAAKKSKGAGGNLWADIKA